MEPARDIIPVSAETFVLADPGVEANLWYVSEEGKNTAGKGTAASNDYQAEES